MDYEDRETENLIKELTLVKLKNTKYKNLITLFFPILFHYQEDLFYNEIFPKLVFYLSFY